MEPRLVLASASPRRARLLEAMGLAFRVRAANIDESLRPGEDGAAAAERLARAKALAVAGTETLPVLAADTDVVLDGRILGKPGSADEAAAMLRSLSGRTHQVVSGVCLRTATGERFGVDRTDVTFVTLTDAEIAWYVKTGEPMDKAGGYHVDGAGSAFIRSVQGSPSNVAGLPVRLVLELAREAGVSLGIP